MNYSLEDVVLRPWRETDMANLMSFANNPKIFNNLTDAFPIPYTKEAATRFLSWASVSRNSFSMRSRPTTHSGNYTSR